MKPKFSYTNATDIPTPLKDFYTEKDGVWTLDVEGAASAERLREFRDNNITLQGKVKELEMKYNGIDPDEVAKLTKEHASFKAAAAKADGKLDEEIAKRTQVMKAEYDKALAELNQKVQSASTELATLKIDKAALEIGSKFGLRPTAQTDIVARARNTFKLGDDGKVTPIGPDGKPIYGKSGEPITLAEWVEAQAKEAPHLFEPNGGGGSAGGKGGGGGSGGAGGVNPWKQGSVNLTMQGRLLRDDPATARRLAAEAGVKLPEKA